MDPLTQILLQRAQQPPTQPGLAGAAPGVGPVNSPMPQLLNGGRLLQTPPDAVSNDHLWKLNNNHDISDSLDAMAGKVPPHDINLPSSGLPVVPPSTPSKVPPETQRFMNAQKIQDAYRGGWAPNPVLLRALLGHR